MFLCWKCHSRTKCKLPHIFRSHGRCEGCGKTALCVDCKTYKNTALAEDQAKLSILQGEVVRFLQDQGCHPYGLVHESTFFNYQNIRFEMKLTLLPEGKST